MSAQTFSRLDSVGDDCQDLFQKGESENISYSLAWFNNIINTVFSNNPGVRICVLRKNNVASALLPIVLINNYFGKSIKSLSNYYTSLYAPIIKENVTAQDLSTMLTHLMRESRPIESFRFFPLDPDSKEYSDLMKACSISGLVVFEYYCFGNWYEKIDSSWNNYLQSRSGFLRSTLKRATKKLEKAGGHIELISNKADVERGISAYQYVYENSGKHYEPYPDFIPNLIRLCAEKNWLRLGLVWIDSLPIAAQIWIVANGKAEIYKLAYHQAFKSYSPGTLLTGMLMEQALDIDCVTEVDYLIGDDPYKKSWMSQRRERWGIIAFNPKTIGGLVGLCREFLTRFLKSALRRETKDHYA